LINSSCAWASELHELEELYKSVYTGAVTTRTATLNGFTEDSSHTVVFSKDSVSSLNSYGYSPHPLSTYLSWIQAIIQNDPNSSKPFIISVTSSSPSSLSSMLDAIQDLRSKLHDSEGYISRIAVELNTSCPNIKGSPPPAYSVPALVPLLNVLAEHHRKDTTLTIGLKLPPYFYSTQFEDMLRCISGYSGVVQNPFAFLTCTNTVGSCLLFTDQIDHTVPSTGQFALPTTFGGLAGESIHALSLGNVCTFVELLASAEDEMLRGIKIIGVGGVTSPEAAVRMRRAGASVVGCATLLGKLGVTAFERLSGLLG